MIYDSDCGFCKWCLALLLSLERGGGGNGALRPLPLGTPEADRLLADLTVEERDASWHLVIDGERSSAGAALAPAMAFVRGGRVPATAFRRFPGASERGYRWVADHRGLLGRFVPARARRWAGRVIAAHGAAPQ